MKKGSMILLLTTLMVGCHSTAGPFVTDVTTTPQGLKVERCMLDYNRFLEYIDTYDCEIHQKQ